MLASSQRAALYRRVNISTHSDVMLPPWYQIPAGHVLQDSPFDQSFVRSVL